ncbi:MAG: metallophosphoesterase family protein [Candidatus Saliniplasma sp.]
MKCIFVSDLHGKKERYRLLQMALRKHRPDAVFLGGDLLPSFVRSKDKVRNFLYESLLNPLQEVRTEFEKKLRCFVIMGNDDPRIFEDIFEKFDEKGLIHYVNQRCVNFRTLNVCGYSFVPPTPFDLKDWEKYDVSRFTDVGALSPEKGTRTVKVEENEIEFATIKKDLNELKKLSNPQKTIYMFHAPPYETLLDRADLDGEEIDHAPLDVHVGSIAIKNFIQNEQPYLTLHGHVHETIDLTGEWKCVIDGSFCFSGVTSGKGLAVVVFDTENLDSAHREILTL